MSEQVVNEDDAQAITVKDIKEKVVNEEEDVHIISEKDIKEEEEDIFDMVTPQESIISEVKSHSKDRHKQVECQVCLCKMRCDNLKRHMLKHRELHTLDENEIRDEIKRRKKLLETKEDHEQLIRQIAAEEWLQPEHCDIDTADVLNPISVKKQLIDDALIYRRKIERGNIITAVLEEGRVPEDSLSKDNREVLQIYRKQMSRRNLSNVKLRSWQLMDNIYTPSG